MMKSYRPKLYKSNGVHFESRAYGNTNATAIARPAPQNLSGNFKLLGFIVLAMLITNLITHALFNPAVGGGASIPSGNLSGSMISRVSAPKNLYLMDQASLFVYQPQMFEKKVREIADMLGVAPEWLMAVMYSESKFDAAVKNYKGSGATGLIQFMPAAASEMGVTLDQLGRMSHVQQLDYVYMYLQTVRDRYGNFDNLTDLYLAILYPKALNYDYCYTLYASPTKSFKQNSGLDENKDGRVTVSDIDRRMQRLYPEAYMAKV